MAARKSREKTVTLEDIEKSVAKGMASRTVDPAKAQKKYDKKWDKFIKKTDKKVDKTIKKTMKDMAPTT